MNQTVGAYINNFFFARARALAVKNFLFALLVLGCSSGLIQAEKKKSNPDRDRWQKNRELAKKQTSDFEVTLMDALKNDASPMIRQGAAQQLGNYSQNPLVVDALANALHNEADKSVRCACALSLGLSPTFKAINALEKVATDPDADLRRQVAFSLQRHRVGRNKVKAEALLKKLQKDNDASVREMAGAK